jgi:hypothetical protein
MSEPEIITLIGVIISSIVAIISIRSYRLKKRQGEQPIINDIICNFIIQACVKLVDDRFNSKDFPFPKSLNLSYGISTDDYSFKRFSKRKHFFAWKILRYNKFCKKINCRIGSLHAHAEMHHLITSLRDDEGIQFELSEQYRNYSMEQLNEILMEYNYPFIDTLKGIKKLQKRMKVKAEKLLNQLQKIKDKWKEQYNIV